LLCEKNGFLNFCCFEQVKMACREAMGFSRSFGSSDDDKANQQCGQSEEILRKSPQNMDSSLWWKNQIRTQIDHDKAEGIERENSRQLAVFLSDQEQRRRVQEEAINSMEETEERKRRREFAKAVIREEQWTRLRENGEAAIRDENERIRRRRMAIKALKAEEARQIELRLQSKALLKTASLDIIIHDEQVRQAVRQRQRALFQAGIRLHMQYFRAMENERLPAAGDKIVPKRSNVEQAVRDLYLRDCIDSQDGSLPSDSSKRQTRPAARVSSLNHQVDHAINFPLTQASLPMLPNRGSSAAGFFRPLPSFPTADWSDICHQRLLA
jgi:hypothetical protein